MKKITILCVAIAIASFACGALTVYATSNNNAPETASIVGEKHDYIFDGMYFNSANVAEIFFYGPEDNINAEGCSFYITYDDIDAGCDCEVIRINRETYQAILDATEAGYEICGELRATKEFESVEYALTPDSEMI